MIYQPHQWPLAMVKSSYYANLGISRSIPRYSNHADAELKIFNVLVVNWRLFGEMRISLYQEIVEPEHRDITSILEPE